MSNRQPLQNRAFEARHLKIIVASIPIFRTSRQLESCCNFVYRWKYGQLSNEIKILKGVQNCSCWSSYQFFSARRYVRPIMLLSLSLLSYPSWDVRSWVACSWNVRLETLTQMGTQSPKIFDIHTNGPRAKRADFGLFSLSKTFIF